LNALGMAMSLKSAFSTFRNCKKLNNAIRCFFWLSFAYFFVFLVV
jgi:hypothetical protein